jgi:hypothetical protein
MNEINSQIDQLIRKENRDISLVELTLIVYILTGGLFLYFII